MKPKRLPRLWCALQGLLPFDACLAAQRGELAWPAEKHAPPKTDEPRLRDPRIDVAVQSAAASVEGNESVRNQNRNPRGARQHGG